VTGWCAEFRGSVGGGFAKDTKRSSRREARVPAMCVTTRYAIRRRLVDFDVTGERWWWWGRR